MKEGSVVGIWKMIHLAIWLVIWKERNFQVFEGKALCYKDFRLYFLKILCSWCEVFNGGRNFGFFGF